MSFYQNRQDHQITTSSDFQFMMLAITYQTTTPKRHLTRPQTTGSRYPARKTVAISAKSTKARRPDTPNKGMQYVKSRLSVCELLLIFQPSKPYLPHPITGLYRTPSNEEKSKKIPKRGKLWGKVAECGGKCVTLKPNNPLRCTYAIFR